VLVPVVPPPNSEGVVVSPPVEGTGFVEFPKILPPLPNGLGTGSFAPNKLLGVVPGAGAVEVAPLPNKPPPVEGVVAVVVGPGAGAVEVAPKSEPAGFEPKMFDVVVVVPVLVVPVPVVPVPVAGVGFV
jgi:hypothetical protein